LRSEVLAAAVARKAGLKKPDIGDGQDPPSVEIYTPLKASTLP
jgi:hypothetical protein